MAKVLVRPRPPQIVPAQRASIVWSARNAIVYREENDDSDHELVACIDLGSGLSVTGMFRVRWDDGESGGVVFDAA